MRQAELRKEAGRFDNRLQQIKCARDLDFGAQTRDWQASRIVVRAWAEASDRRRRKVWVFFQNDRSSCVKPFVLAHMPYFHGFDESEYVVVGFDEPEDGVIFLEEVPPLPTNNFSIDSQTAARRFGRPALATKRVEQVSRRFLHARSFHRLSS